jgi:molecular chaperone DnaK
LVYQTDKNLNEYGDKLQADAKNKIEAAVNRLKEAAKTDNINEIRSATEALNQVWNEASSNLYQQAGPQGPSAGQDSTSQDSQKTSDETVEEADFEVVDDDNKEK